jgi:hypothetical protein
VQTAQASLHAGKHHVVRLARVVDESTRRVHPPKKKKTENRIRMPPTESHTNPQDCPADRLASSVRLDVGHERCTLENCVPGTQWAAGRVIRWRGPGVFDQGKQIWGLVRGHGGEEKQADCQS